MSHQPPASFDEGIRWLRDHADELQAAPLRLHDAVIGDRDLSGSLRYSAPFWAILLGDPYAIRTASEIRACPMEHPYDGHCERCDDRMSYTVYREVYVQPLSAALARLRREPPTSKGWPSPYALCLTLLRCDGELDVAAAVIGQPILGPDHRKTMEAAFLLAIRKLIGRWSSGPIPKIAKAVQREAEAA